MKTKLYRKDKGGISTPVYIALSFFALIFAISVSVAQTPVGNATIDINNVDALINDNGTMFWDFMDAQYYVPAPAPGTLGKSTMFSQGLWVGGLDPQGA